MELADELMERSLVAQLASVNRNAPVYFFGQKCNGNFSRPCTVYTRSRPILCHSP